jgi:hypothetical protein
MAHRLTVPTLSALALAGVGFGVFLGQAAISEISPSSFSDPAPRFHADLTPHRSQSAPAALPQQGAMLALGASCIDCRSGAAEQFPVYEAAAGGYRSGYAATADVPEPVQVTAEPSPEDVQHQVELARVELYASYPVSHDQAAPPEDQRVEPAVD